MNKLEPKVGDVVLVRAEIVAESDTDAARVLVKSRAKNVANGWWSLAICEIHSIEPRQLRVGDMVRPRNLDVTFPEAKIVAIDDGTAWVRGPLFNSFIALEHLIRAKDTQ